MACSEGEATDRARSSRCPRGHVKQICGMFFQSCNAVLVEGVVEVVRYYYVCAVSLLPGELVSCDQENKKDQV